MQPPLAEQPPLAALAPLPLAALAPLAEQPPLAALAPLPLATLAPLAVLAPLALLAPLLGAALVPVLLSVGPGSRPHGLACACPASRRRRQSCSQQVPARTSCGAEDRAKRPHAFAEARL